MLPLWIALLYLFGRWAKGEIKKQQAKEYVRQHPPESLRSETRRRQQRAFNDRCNYYESIGINVSARCYRDENGDWKIKPKSDK